MTIEPAGAHSPDPRLPGPAAPDPAPAKTVGEVRYSVLSLRVIWTAAALILLVGVGVAVWLLVAYGRGGNELEAIKTAGTIVVGTGGAAALLLAARRQRSAEIALKQKDRDQADVARAHALQERIAAENQAHQERVAADTREDAAARRITELYTKAADQLGSDKAPVRLAGLYALERLAQDNPGQRLTIVNVLCAYLRMPYQLPGEPPTADAEEQIQAVYRERVQERQVRLTAQRLVTDHLRPLGSTHPFSTFWPNITLDLTDAVLINFGLSGCTVGNATFRSATFAGHADFRWTTFTGHADFESATFTGKAIFQSATFTGLATFGAATFTDYATLGAATFTGHADFRSATFTGHANFESATFTGHANFESATFTGYPTFGAATFRGGVPAEVARFLRPAAEDVANTPGTR